MKNLMIEVDNLRRNFKEVEAVAGISFSVQQGEIYGLLGPNGAGKTTTIRMLTGQIDPSGGRATVAGYNVVKDRDRLKALIGVVFEEPNLYERLSARNNLRFNCWLYDLPESRIDQVLDLVSLRERAKDPVRTFSNGMKQRLMVARALLHKPPVLFLDEPTRGLDPIAGEQFGRYRGDSGQQLGSADYISLGSTPTVDSRSHDLTKVNHDTFCPIALMLRSPRVPRF